MGSRNHIGDPSLIVGYKIYYHDGTGETLDIEGAVIRPLVNIQIVSVPPNIAFTDWVGQWAIAPDLNVQVVMPFTDMTYIKDLNGGVEQPRRVHELVFKRTYYYLDVSQGQTVAAFKWANQFSDIPPTLRILAKQGKEISEEIWHAVYDLAYEDWGI